MLWYLNILLAYLIGSVNGSILVSSALKLKDPRQDGSNNPGATNMMRLHGKTPAILAFAIDFSKAIIAIKLLPAEQTLYIAAAVCLGHIFPVFYRFKGGKGVAVTAGIMFGLSIKLALLAVGTWACCFKICKISSLSAMAALVAVAVSYLLPLTDTAVYQALIIPGLAVVLSHHSNFKRLLQGSERPPIS